MDKGLSHSNDHKDILDYYHSPLAGQGHFYQLAKHSRQPSTISTSSSEYSCLSDIRDATSSDASSSQISQVTRRSSIPSVGSADRRRIAIVEMDAPVEESSLTATHSSHDPSSTLRERRGLQTNLSGLAIVAPPDAAPNSFLTPPSTAPIRTSNNSVLTISNSPSHHHRSASEILPSRKIPPRDIGIVGTAQLTLGAKQQQGKSDMQPQNDNSSALRPPIFQQPKSASPSPSSTPDPSPHLAPIRGLNIMKREKPREKPVDTSCLHPDSTSTTPSPQSTPDMGGEGHVRVPVASPVVVGLDAAVNDVVGGIRLVTQPKPEQAQTPVSTTTTTVSPPTLILPTSNPDPTLSYVNYQPGIHSTAGPLPPPPRLPGFDVLSAAPNSPPPPRPPRLSSPLPPRNATRSKDIEAVKQALQLPPSVSAVLASQGPTTSRGSAIRDLTSTITKGNLDSVATTAVARSTSTSTMPSSPSFSDSSSSSYSMLQPVSSVHRREGAFPPSSASTDPGSESFIDNERGASEKRLLVSKSERSNSGDVPHVTIISEPPPPPSPILESAAEENENNDGDLHLRQPTRSYHRREQGEVINVLSDGDEDSNENWVSVSRVSSPSSQHDRSTSDSDLNPVNANGANGNVGIDRESLKTPSEAPSPPPKSFRNSLTTGLKRFSSRSLPRTPSISSGSRRSSSVMSKRFSTGSTNLGSTGSGGVDMNRTPSPSLYSAPLPLHTNGAHGQAQTKRVRQKTVMQWPSAMFCNEIHTGGKRKMSSSERCAIYAQKINELYMHDCGLTEWVVEMRFRGPNSNPNGAGINNKKFSDARSPASAPFTPQPRQTSRSSMISDATFPTRPDASTATDLLSSSRDDDGGYHEDVPILPYPSLATAQRAAASNTVPANMTPPASIRSLGSNSTLPSMVGSNNNTHPHTPTNTRTSLTQSPTAVHHAIPVSPLPNKSITSISTPSGGFFASLGRKASLSSAKRPNIGLGLGNLISSPISTSSSSSSGIMSPSSTHRFLAKSTTAGPGKQTPSKPVSVGGITMNPSTPPSVAPGGPRAPSSAGNNRVQRSKTYIPSTSSPFSGAGFGVGMGATAYSPNANMERRPSLWELQVNSLASGLASPASGSNTPTAATQSYIPHPYGHDYVAIDQYQPQPHQHFQQPQYAEPQQQQQAYDPHTDPEFVRQVDKLAELLPDADRMVLAGYLRRAGQDVLAIGQYLEDAKNGTLKAY